MVKGRIWRLLTFSMFIYIMCFLYFMVFPSPAGEEANKVLEVYNKGAVVVDGNEKHSDQVKGAKQMNKKTKKSDLEPFLIEGVLGNYEPKKKIKRSGPGENGEGVELSGEDVERGKKAVAEFGFNEVASEKISLDRQARDTRPEECKYWNYPSSDKLPKASVVLVFHDEGWSTLVRTIHSIINTSPEKLLKDIILVDDYSNQEHITVHLPKYIERWNGLVKYIRTNKRVGLIEARIIGARAMKGEVLVILDAHCECVTNWLPPLLTRIALNRKTLAIPVVDTINWNTLKHSSSYGGALHRGIWEWGFLYKESVLPDRERNQMEYETEPYKSPTHAGGLLAIDKKWFFELGGYDPGIKTWGGEQYELSFKIWMCGGQIEWVPCSHVGHIYRGPRKRDVDPPNENPYQTEINYLRVADVWMDEFKRYYLRRQPHHAHLNFGDASGYKALRKRLNCSSFQWYLDNVAYEMAELYPLPPANLVWGEMRSAKYPQKCADALQNKIGRSIGITNCHNHGGNQLFRINFEGEWSAGEHCLISQDDNVVLRHCIQFGRWVPTGEWTYDHTKKQVRSKTFNKCVTTDGKRLFLDKCRQNALNQQWKWKETYLK